MRLVAGALGLCVALLAPAARGDTFRYVDRDGREHSVRIGSDDPSVPPPARTASDSLPPPSRSEARPIAPEAPTAPPTTSAASWAPRDDEPFPYASFVIEAAQLYSLPVELVRAVMTVESGGHPRAVSSSGALGLMQLMPFTAADLELTDPFDPRQNVLGGARLLRILVNTFDGDLTLALAAYHAGAGRVRRSGGMPDIPETRRYVAMVLSIFHRLQLSTGPARLSSLAAR